MKIKPINNRILIKKINKEIKNNFGIIIPEINKEKPDQGIVIELNDKNKIIKNEFKIGDKVLFNKYSGQNIKLENEEFVLIREEDILAIITE